MKPVVLRAAWAVVIALVLVNAGVAATWSSRHPRTEAASQSVTPTESPVGTMPVAPSVDTTTPPGTAPIVAGRNSSPAASSATSTPPASNSDAAVAANRGNFEFDLDVDPDCATRLADMQATIKAVPGAYVSMIVAYSDGKSYGTMYAGPVSDDGTFVLRWKVPATAATGKGRVLASGHDPAANTSGNNTVDFTIVEGKGC